MTGITFQQTRVYQEIKEECQQEVKAEASLQLAEMLRSLLQQRLGKKAIPWGIGLLALEFETLTGLGKELLNLESPRDVLEWLMLDQGGARIRQGVPERFLAGILGNLDESATQRLKTLTVDEGLSLVDCLEGEQSLTQLRKGVREWLVALVAGEG